MLRLAYFLQKNGDFSGENTVSTGVLQLTVLKRLVVLKGPIFNIFLSRFTAFRNTFGMTVCLKIEIVDGIFKNGNIAFCYDVKTRRAAAPPVLDPLFLN